MANDSYFGMEDDNKMKDTQSHNPHNKNSSAENTQSHTVITIRLRLLT